VEAQRVPGEVAVSSTSGAKAELEFGAASARCKAEGRVEKGYKLKKSFGWAIARAAVSI
jgi:hypothetical protein